jgi:hypothetical protein
VVNDAVWSGEGGLNAPCFGAAAGNSGCPLFPGTDISLGYRILDGDRSLTTRHIKKLARYFHVGRKFFCNLRFADWKHACYYPNQQIKSLKVFLYFIGKTGRSPA